MKEYVFLIVSEFREKGIISLNAYDPTRYACEKTRKSDQSSEGHTHLMIYIIYLPCTESLMQQKKAKAYSSAKEYKKWLYSRREENQSSAKRLFGLLSLAPKTQVMIYSKLWSIITKTTWKSLHRPFIKHSSMSIPDQIYARLSTCSHYLANKCKRTNKAKRQGEA